MNKIILGIMCTHGQREQIAKSDVYVMNRNRRDVIMRDTAQTIQPTHFTAHTRRNIQRVQDTRHTNINTHISSHAESMLMLQLFSKTFLQIHIGESVSAKICTYGLHFLSIIHGIALCAIMSMCTISIHERLSAYSIPVFIAIQTTIACTAYIINQENSNNVVKFMNNIIIVYMLSNIILIAIGMCCLIKMQYMYLYNQHQAFLM